MLARAFAIVAGTLACGLPGAQEPPLPRVGFLASTIPTRDLVDGTSNHPAFRAMVDGLRARGWVDGKNMRFVWRSAESDLTRLSALVDELVRERVDVIVGYGPGAYVALERTESVPVVMGVSAVTGPLTVDGKVRVKSLAKPGGNVTGLALAIGPELDSKRLEILKQAAPHITRVALLSHVASPEGIGPSRKAAAERLGLTLHTFGFGRNDASGLEAAFAEMARQRMDAVIMGDHPTTHLASTQAIIHRLAERHRIVVLHQALSGADTGGLLAYGADIDKLYRRVPHFVDRILRGTKPGDIPFEQPAELELRVNLKAAKAIGLTLPQSLLLQASRVTE